MAALVSRMIAQGYDICGPGCPDGVKECYYLRSPRMFKFSEMLAGVAGSLPCRMATRVYRLVEGAGASGVTLGALNTAPGLCGTGSTYARSAAAEGIFNISRYQMATLGDTAATLASVEPADPVSVEQDELPPAETEDQPPTVHPGIPQQPRLAAPSSLPSMHEIAKDVDRFRMLQMLDAIASNDPKWADFVNEGLAQCSSLQAV